MNARTSRSELGSALAWIPVLLAGHTAAAAEAGPPEPALRLLQLYDNCVGADVVPNGGAGPWSRAFDPAGATDSTAGAECMCSGAADAGIADDIWLDWTAPLGVAAVRISLCGAVASDTKLSVRTGACPGTPIACNDDAQCSVLGESEVVIACTANTVYHLRVGRPPASLFALTPGVITITPLPAGPGHDGCNLPLAVSGALPIPFDSTNATSGTEGQCDGACSFAGATGIANDLWFAWTSGFNGTAQISTCAGTTFDSKVAVYSGTACPPGAPLACDDDGCSPGGGARAQFAVTLNGVYMLQIGSHSGSPGGAGTFQVTEVVPAPLEDDCAQARVLTGPGPWSVVTTNATTGLQGQADAACNFVGGTAIDRDVWLAWTPACTGRYRLSMCSGTGFDAKLAAYSGGTCPTAGALACDDDVCGVSGPPSVLVDLVGLAPITIQVGSHPTVAGGTGTLTIDFVPTSAPGAPFCASGDPFFPGCPCGNAGDADRGCANSANARGGWLTAQGDPLNDDVVLFGSGMPATSSCIYLKGSGFVDDGSGNFGGIGLGDGVRCIAGTLIRLRTKFNVNGASCFPDGDDMVTLSTRGATPPGSGLIGYYQTYYRNAAPAFCPPATYNVTSGYVVTW